MICCDDAKRHFLMVISGWQIRKFRCTLVLILLDLFAKYHLLAVHAVYRQKDLRGDKAY